MFKLNALKRAASIIAFLSIIVPSQLIGAIPALADTSFVTDGTELLSQFSFAQPDSAWRIDTSGEGGATITAALPTFDGPSDAGIDDTTGWTEVYSGDTDDGFKKINLGFNTVFNGETYDNVFVGSNTYISFGHGASNYDGLNYDMPAVPAVHICSGDHSYQHVLYKAGEGSMRIRYEGNNDTEGTLGDPTIVYEAVFYADAPYFYLNIGLNSACSPETLPAQFRGTQTVGYQLSGSSGTFEYTAEPTTLTYQWQRSSDNDSFTDIPGSTSINRILTNADAGKYIRLKVTQTVDDVDTVKYSDSTNPVSVVHQISDCEQLMSADTDYGDDSNDDVYILTADIDCTDYVGAMPLAWYNDFSGIFDGKDHTISNLTIIDEDSNVGLFAQTAGPTIKNLQLDFETVAGLGETGGLIGYANSGVTTISNVHITRSQIDGYADHVGGLIGQWDADNDYLLANSLSDSSFQGEVGGYGAMSVGGLIGKLHVSNGDMYIETSYAAATVHSGEQEVGGLIGNAEVDFFNLHLNEVYTHGTVNASQFAGGLIGYATVSTDSAGGDNPNSFDILNSYAYNSVYANSADGGLIGYAAVNGDVGLSSSMNLTNVYASGVIGGDDENGGLIGSTGGIFNDDAINISTSFAASMFDVGGGYGGVIGYINGGDSLPTLTNVYFDAFNVATVNADNDSVLTSGFYPINNGGGDPDYFFTSIHMPMDDWNFSDIWMYDIESDYPHLAFTIRPSTVVAVSASDVGQTSATINGDVTHIKFGELWGGYGATVTKLGDTEGTNYLIDADPFPVSEGEFSIPVTNLTCGTDYTYSVFLTTEGPNRDSFNTESFTTAACSTGHKDNNQAPSAGGGNGVEVGDSGNHGGGSGGGGGSTLPPVDDSHDTNTETHNSSDVPDAVNNDQTGHNEATDSTATGPSPFTGETQPISAVKAGWYIRGENYDTIYLVTPDMTRRPFWDKQTFFTYANSWDDVVWVTDATLQTLKLDLPMTPKPGSVLAKIQGESSTYAVSEDADKSPLLRLIPDEVTALKVYGQAWANYVIDLPPTIWHLFKVGASIASGDSADLSQMKTRMGLNNH